MACAVFSLLTRLRQERTHEECRAVSRCVIPPGVSLQRGRDRPLALEAAEPTPRLPLGARCPPPSHPGPGARPYGLPLTGARCLNENVEGGLVSDRSRQQESWVFFPWLPFPRSLSVNFQMCLTDHFSDRKSGHSGGSRPPHPRELPVPLTRTGWGLRAALRELPSRVPEHRRLASSSSSLIPSP